MRKCISTLCSCMWLATPILADNVWTNDVGDATFAKPGPVHVVVQPGDGGGVIAGECGPYVYESGDASSTGSGRTVGGPSGTWTVIQPFVLASDTTVCSLGLDGWCVFQTPPEFDASIYLPDVSNPAIPDISAPVTGGLIAFSTDPFSVHWVDVEVEPACLVAGQTYYMVTTAASTHWSAIYNAPSGMSSYSIFGGDYSQRYYTSPIAMRLRGNPDCGAACNPCDANCDGSVNLFDISPFVNQLSSGDPGCSPCAADANNDGSINLFDISPFVDCLTG